jgi:hypothetical protein
MILLKRKINRDFERGVCNGGHTRRSLVDSSSGDSLGYGGGDFHASDLCGPNVL